MELELSFFALVPAAGSPVLVWEVKPLLIPEKQKRTRELPVLHSSTRGCSFALIPCSLPSVPSVVLTQLAVGLGWRTDLD